MGSPADARTRKARARAHDAFDRLWRHGLMSRVRAYSWMAEILGIDKEEAHIGSLDSESCRRLCDAVRAEFPDLFPFDP